MDTHGYYPPAVGNDFDTNNLIYVTDALNETFNSSDFIYGPQLWKSCSSADYPLYNGEDMSDTNNTFQIMFIDLDVGALQTGINGGAIEVNYNFTDSTKLCCIQCIRMVFGK